MVWSLLGHWEDLYSIILGFGLLCNQRKIKRVGRSHEQEEYSTKGGKTAFALTYLLLIDSQCFTNYGGMSLKDVNPGEAA